MNNKELNRKLIDLIGVACLALKGEYDKDDAYNKLNNAIMQWREMNGFKS